MDYDGDASLVYASVPGSLGTWSLVHVAFQGSSEYRGHVLGLIPDAEQLGFEGVAGDAGHT